MDNDVKRLSEALDGFDYREVAEGGRLERACERWPLLAAVHRALRSERGPSAVAAQPMAADGAAALWEE
ncbi:MAG: BcsR/BcsP family cellulose biosynthesis protein [Polyangiales bacterium]